MKVQFLATGSILANLIEIEVATTEWLSTLRPYLYPPTWEDEVPWVTVSRSELVQPHEAIVFPRGTMGFESGSAHPELQLEMTDQGIAYLTSKTVKDRLFCLVLKDTPVHLYRAGELMARLTTGMFVDLVNKPTEVRPFALEEGSVLDFQGPFAVVTTDKRPLRFVTRS